MRFAIILLLVSSACIVPPSQREGSSDALLSQAQQDLDKYFTDHKNGVAYVRCLAGRTEIYSSTTEAARAIAAGCDASLAAALPKLERVEDIDPILVDGTTVGFVIRYNPEPLIIPVIPEPPVEEPPAPVIEVPVLPAPTSEPATTTPSTQPATSAPVGDNG